MVVRRSESIFSLWNNVVEWPILETSISRIISNGSIRTNRTKHRPSIDRCFLSKLDYDAISSSPWKLNYDSIMAFFERHETVIYDEKRVYYLCPSSSHVETRVWDKHLWTQSMRQASVTVYHVIQYETVITKSVKLWSVKLLSVNHSSTLAQKKTYHPLCLIVDQTSQIQQNPHLKFWLVLSILHESSL